MRFRVGGTVLTLQRPQVVVVGLVVLVMVFTLYKASSWAWANKDRPQRKEQYASTDHFEGPHRKYATGSAKNRMSIFEDKVVKHHARIIGEDYGESELDERRARAVRLLQDLKPAKPAAGGADGRTEDVVMAMDVARQHRGSVIDKVQKKLITGQKRAPDSRYNINVTNSDLQSLDRDIPDIRPPICRRLRYDIPSLPTATVIIPFYNEALTMLLRTVHSVLNRSPDNLLDEVILVDDHSTDEHLQGPLETYVRLLPKTRLLRNSERSGLIVSRMKGADVARSPVLIFLDAHTEANIGWLEPMLDELRRNRKQVLQPFVDAIDAMSLEIGAPTEYHKGAFSWDLRYTWLRMSSHEQQRTIETGQPFFSPTLVGCAIAVDKAYFLSLGAFDDGLRIWGGENIELAFRTWMCGGKAVTVTCSHVGHVFKPFSYKFDGDKEATIQKNLIRVAETWMDGMSKYFYASSRVYDFKRARLDADEQASLDTRKLLRQRLQCRNFEWYLYNVIPEVAIPPMDAVYYGEIKNIKSNACWEVADDNDSTVGLTFRCYEHKIIPENHFSLTVDGLLRYKDRCVSIHPPMLVIRECPPATTNKSEMLIIWELQNEEVVWGRLVAWVRNSVGERYPWCITQVTSALSMHYRKQMPQALECDVKNNFQAWSFTYKFDYSHVPNSTAGYTL